MPDFPGRGWATVRGTASEKQFYRVLQGVLKKSPSLYFLKG
tara:strand:- start:634 stop:756 length:123 start_codon:yes stop_codon:yes gene_type:complete